LLRRAGRRDQAHRKNNLTARAVAGSNFRPSFGLLPHLARFSLGFRELREIGNNLVLDDVPHAEIIDITGREDVTMKSVSTRVASLIAALAVTSSAPAYPAPIFVPNPQGAQSNVLQVRDGWRGGNYNWYHGHGHHGHGGYNDFWSSGGALIGGALLGSLIANGLYGGGYYGGPYNGGGYYGGPYYGGGYYGGPYNGGGYYGGPYYGGGYYGHRYYGHRYYGHRYYIERNYGHRYYSNRYHSNRSYRPCSPREQDSGNCS
jgi:hypothetical protein